MGTKFDPGNRMEATFSSESTGFSPLPSISCAAAIEVATVPLAELELKAAFLLGLHLTEAENKHLPECPYQRREMLQPLLRDRLDELLPDE